MSTRKRNRASVDPDEPRETATTAAAATLGSSGTDNTNTASTSMMPPSKKARRAESQAKAKALLQHVRGKSVSGRTTTAPATTAEAAPANGGIGAAAVATESVASPAIPKKKAARASLNSQEAQRLLAQTLQQSSPKSLEQHRMLQLLEKAKARHTAPAAATSTAAASVPVPVAPTRPAAHQAVASPPRPTTKTNFQSSVQPSANRASLSLQQPRQHQPSPATAAVVVANGLTRGHDVVGVPPRAKPSTTTTTMSNASTPRRTAAATCMVAPPPPARIYEEHGNSDDEEDVALLSMPHHIPVPPASVPEPAPMDVHPAETAEEEVGEINRPQGSRRGIWTLIAVVVVCLLLLGVALYPTQHFLGKHPQLAAPQGIDNNINVQVPVGGPPCYQTFPLQLDHEVHSSAQFEGPSASAVLVEWAPHCPRHTPEKFLPCPPHAICRGGKIVSCESYLWIPQAPPKTQATNDIHWPTKCVLSGEAEVLLSSIVPILEGWTSYSTCPVDGNSAPPAAAHTTTAEGSDDRPLFSYSDVLAELERKGQDQQLLQDMLFPDSDLFQELAEGRLAMDLTQTTTLSTNIPSEDSDVTTAASSTLWIGLPPSHKVPIPAKCILAKFIVWVLQGARYWISTAVWSLIVFASVCVAFCWDVIWIVLTDSPVMCAAICGAVSLVYWIVLPRWHRRKTERQLSLDVAEAHRLALEVLKKETHPLYCLALRDAVREQHPPDVKKSHFNKTIWPTVQTRLERDQRISVHMHHGGDATMVWVGPKAN